MRPADEVDELYKPWPRHDKLFREKGYDGEWNVR